MPKRKERILSMASQDAKSNERQQEQPQKKDMARSSQSGGLAQRGSYDPFPFSLRPGGFFDTTPFTLMRRMTEEMDRVFGEFGVSRGSAAAWSPAIEVSEREGKYTVRAELPGLKPEDVKLEITNDALVLEGERKFEHDETNGGVHRTERRYGHFYRVIQLPEGTNAEEARAKFENGVVEVTVPVPQQRKGRRQIPIEGGSTSSAGEKHKVA